MQSRLKLFQSFWVLGARKNPSSFTRGVRYVSEKNRFLWNPFCTVTEPVHVDDSFHATESPDLPHWIKSSSNGANALEKSDDHDDDDDDDFVIPSLSNWIENHQLRHPEVDLERGVDAMSDSDVDRISKILKNAFDSPDAVAEALNGCGVDVTEDLIKQILERFSFDWIPCLGFFKWAKSRKGSEFSPELYNLMVDNLGKSRKFGLMFELVEEMKQLEAFITLDTMIKVIRRLAKARKLDDAIGVFRNLDQFGVPMNIRALNLLVDALVKHRGVEHAKTIIPEFEKIISPNAYTFNILVHGWCKARKLEEARKTVVEMKKHGINPDVITYTCFIEAHCREKDFRKVDAMLKNMKELGLVPSVVTYTIIMNALGKAKEMNRVLEFYEEMKQNGCVPDNSVYSILIENLRKSGRLKDARELFEDMAKQGVEPDTLTYNTIIAAFARESKEEDALLLLKKMEESRCKPDLLTYAALLKMCFRLRRMKLLSFLLNHMYKNNVSIDLGTYSLLVTGLCASGSVSRACLYFEESVKRGFVPTDAMYEKLVNKIQEKGMNIEKDRIEELMQQAKLHNSVESSTTYVQVQE